MFSPAKLVVAGAIAALFGGFLLVGQPSDRQASPVPGAATESEGVTASPEPPLRSSVAWGSKRIDYTPPAGWPPEAVEFRIHDVALIAPTACPRTPSTVEVGPTAEGRLVDALADQTGLERSGPVDVMVDGNPAKRFVIYHPYPPGCPREPDGYGSGGDGNVQIWENRDGTGLGMLDGGFAIVLVADVDGERLVFTGGARGHGFGGPMDEMNLARLEADADALVASMEIVEPDPMAAAWVTGTCPYSGTQVGTPTVTVEDGVTKSYGGGWEDFRPCDMSDPRLIGTGALMGNTHTYAVEGDTPIIVMSQTYRIENEAGTWEGVGGPGLARGAGALETVTDTAVYIGTGAYEGLTAYLVFDFSQNPVTVVGAIFPGELPPIPTFE